MDRKHFDIFRILPYQRNFNLINGSRSIGKTYTVQTWVLQKCLERGKQFIYIVRTKTEKKQGAFQQAYEKVEMQEFPEHEFIWDTETLTIDGEQKGWCIALSEVQEIKKRSFPLVDYFIFDEYMIEEKANTRYVSGWNEPNLLLSLYQTVDRDDDRVKVFMLGNNTSFYNPYHLNGAFNIKPVKLGEIWTSENVLYYYAKESNFVKKQKEQSRFSKMINGTRYGDYATKGKYIEDSDEFIGKHSGNSKYQFTIKVNDNKFGVYYEPDTGLVYISEKVDETNPFVYALTLEDHSENVSLTKVKSGQVKMLSGWLKHGLVRYESMKVKKISERTLYTLA